MSIEAVEYVFQVLAANYGAEWDRSLGRAPLADIKTVWLEALEPFTHSQKAKTAVMWALKNLPERAPNVRQFVALCRQAPAVEEKQLPAPKADPERLKAELAKMSHLREPVAEKKDCRAWAKPILANPKGRTPAVIQMAQNAMAVS